ncbi:MAG TPA: hypothetical protein VMG12_38235 [Polyangiaceae bacterium]|nr:hypothetical protein [Polyangiaceae bacterium]
MQSIHSLLVGSSARSRASVIVVVGALGCGSDASAPMTSSTDGGTGSGLAPAAGGAPSSGAGGASVGQSGNGSSAAGTAGAGGAYAIQDDPSFGEARPCPTLVQPLITDFTPPEGAADADAGADAGTIIPGATFGSFPVTLSGGTFTYPSAAGDPYAVDSDIRTGEWHLSGNIGTYSGFGFYFQGCNRIDASDYLGLSFSIRGNIAPGGGLILSVSTASNDVSYLWLNSQPTPPFPLAEPNSGRCLPAMNQYDGTCATPFYSVPITESETTIEVRWADLSGGKPSASVDPAEITAIGWNFSPPSGAGTPDATAYAVDLFIDDVRFISP